MTDTEDKQSLLSAIWGARQQLIAQEHAEDLRLYDLALRVEGVCNLDQISEDQAMQVLKRLKALRYRVDQEEIEQMKMELPMTLTRYF